MSELTPCNFCVYRSMLARHGAENVTLRAHVPDEPQARRADPPPRQSWIEAVVNDEPEGRALFLALTAVCVC